MPTRRPPQRAAFRRALLPGWCAALLLAASCGDGGTGPTPDPDNPVPSISNLDPAALLQYSDSVTVTVTGSGFVNGAVVRLNGSPRLTTFVSPTQLTAVVPVGQMQQVGTLQVSVFNPAPGGGESAAMPLAVQHRVPTVSQLDPGGSMQGSPAFVLTVRGAGFATGSEVRWNGTVRPTTFVDPFTLTAQIAAADLAAVGTAEVTVFTPAPGGGTSVPRSFPVVVRPNPVPTVASLSPSTIVAGVGGTVTVTGTGFMEGTTVTVGGMSPPPTIVSATQLQFTLTPANVPNAGFAQVVVTNPAPGGGSAGAVLSLTYPLPTLSSISPAQATVDQDSLTLTLTGTGFLSASGVLFNGGPRPTRRLSATELQVDLGASDLATPGSFPLRVMNPSPGGGISNAVPLMLDNPAPTAASVTPAQTDAALDSLVVRITGTGFLASSVVRLDGAPRPTRRISRTVVEAVLSAADLDEGGTLPLTVANPAPGGGVSQTVTVTVTTPAPVLETLPTAGATAGSPGFVLMVHGTGFVRSSEVRWNGQPRPTNYVSSTRLEVSVASADVASPGTAQVTVHTPGGGTSAAAPLVIRTPGPLSFMDTLSVELSVRDMVYDARSGRIYAAVGSTAPAQANTVVAIDPATGTVTGSVLVGSNPTKLALSDDGTALWVALEGTGQVRRLHLPSLTLGTVFSLGEERVESMDVMPGRPGTVAIALGNRCCSPSHEGVAIYDDGVRRPRSTPGHIGYNLVVFGESGNVLYGQSLEGGGFATLRVASDGVAVERVSGISRAGHTLRFARGRVYTSGGGVIDGARHEAVGAMPLLASAMAVDVGLGRVFFAREDYPHNARLLVYDLNTFQLLDDEDSGLPFIYRLVRWGSDGLAVAVDDRIHLFRSPIAGP